MLLEQFTRVWVWDTSLQLIVHALWGLNRAKHRGLFVLLIPIVGDTLFGDPIIMALVLVV